MDSLPNNLSSVLEGDPNSTPSTTFVQADPSNFRAVVQRLTGAAVPQEPSSSTSHRLPSRYAGKPTVGEIGPRRSGFKLHERRQSSRKLEITLNNGVRQFGSGVVSPSERQWSFVGYPGGGGAGEMVMASPVSTLEVYGRGSPRTPMSPVEEEEERAIAEKGFYLHPSPLSTPRGSEPELLTLFPLHSPEPDPSSS